MHEQVTKYYLDLIAGIKSKSKLNVFIHLKRHLMERRAIHMRDLAYDCKITERVLRKIIEAFKNKGIPILASNKGYWISEDKVVIEAYVVRRIATGLSYLKAGHAMRRALRKSVTIQRELEI